MFLLLSATLRICADGGANRLYDEIPRMTPNEDPRVIRERYMPHLITGDLDSLREDVKEFYCGLGVPLIDLSHDQDSTDLEKCIRFLRTSEEWAKYDTVLKALETVVDMDSKPHPFDSLVAIGAHGGRLDHTLSNLSILHAYRDLPLVLCGDGNLTRLVPSGTARIRPCLDMEGPACGLVPLTGQAIASSTGLRWNLSKTRLSIGGLVSTSNIIDADEIWVETDADLIWTTEIKHI